MGLRTEIYRAGYDCELNRFFGHRMVTVVNAEGPFEPCAEAPAALIVSGNLPGVLHAVPARAVDDAYIEDRPRGMIGPMFGGTFIQCSDSRFNELCRRLLGAPFYGAVALHDRFETPEQYDRMST